jgi:hypothetical protein
MEFVIFYRLFERFVGLGTALGAENTQLLRSHLPEELRRSLLTAVCANLKGRLRLGRTHGDS